MSTTDEDRQRLLSPEELAAMADDDYNADEDNQAALAEIGRGSVDDEGEGGEDAGPGAADDDAAVSEAAPARAPAPAPTPAAAPADDAATGEQVAGGKPAPAPGPAPASQSGYTVDLPKDYDDQVKANRAALAEVRRKFDDGELDATERDAQLDKLQDERDELRDIKTRATVSAEMSQQNAQAAWVNTINAFVADAAVKPELGIVDYTKDAAKQADLDAFVRALAAAPGNESKPSRWFLEEAHKRVVALHAIPTTKTAPADVKRKPDASSVVQNLADVPGGAGDADPVSNEFAELDKLDGLAYERAVAALSPEKRDRYLRAV